MFLCNSPFFLTAEVVAVSTQFDSRESGSSRPSEEEIGTTAYFRFPYGFGLVLITRPTSLVSPHVRIDFLPGTVLACQ